MENKNIYFILQHNENNKMFRASFQARQKKKTTTPSGTLLLLPRIVKKT